MTLDPKRLRQDAKRLQETRPPAAGTTGAVRAALPVIYQLREEGVSWPAIAAALAKQGVVQGKDRVPLTTNRLTALVSQIQQQERKKRLRQDHRVRGDTTNRGVGRAQRLSLSPDLAPPTPVSKIEPASTEDDLRRAALDKLQTVLKKE